jgi:hypothetical protein
MRVAAGFSCRIPAMKDIPPDKLNPEDVAKACQHMGRFRIGEAAQTLKSVLGEPSRTTPQPRGATGWVYFLDGPDRYPYLVAAILNDRIIGLQVTGPARARDFSFNHLDLGAGTDTLLKYFGQPVRTQPSGVKDVDLWTYTPWPFSFEVTAGHVTSILITEPAFHLRPAGLKAE